MPDEDPFAAFEAQFEDRDGDGDPQSDTIDVIDFTALSNYELSDRFNSVRDKLLEINEMMAPTTDVGRELHSMRAAAIIEMRKRGML